MTRPPHAHERPRRATRAERKAMIDNLFRVALHYNLSEAAYLQAKDSAVRNPGKASVCYAAVVRSLKYRG